MINRLRAALAISEAKVTAMQRGVAQHLVNTGEVGAAPTEEVGK